MSDPLWPHGLYSTWNSPGHNTGVGSLFLLQVIFPTKEWNWGQLHCRQILYQPSSQGCPVACLPVQETEGTQVQSLGREDPLEEGMATHSSILVCRIPRTEESAGLQSLGLQRVGWVHSNVECCLQNPWGPLSVGVSILMAGTAMYCKFSFTLEVICLHSHAHSTTGNFTKRVGC